MEEEVEEKERKQAEGLITVGMPIVMSVLSRVASFGQAAINGKFSAASLAQFF